MINYIGTSKIIRTAKGQYNVVELNYNSTLPLVGKFMTLNLRMFGTSAFPPNPTSNPWNGLYSIGTTELLYFGPDRNRNIKVELIATNSTQFKLKIYFFMVADVNDWIGVVDVKNNLIFEDEQLGVSNSIYQTLSGFLNVHFTLDSQIINTPVRVELNNQCTLTAIVPSFIVGENLEVNLSGGNSIDYEYFVLVYNKSQIFGSLNFVQDTKLNYARITNVINSVDGINNSMLIAGNGFQSGEANFTIDGNELEVGNIYGVIVIYRENGIWKYCEDIEVSQLGAGYNPIFGDINCKVKDIFFDDEEDGCCSRGIAEGQNVKISGIVEIGSWNIAISEFFSGSFYDYFQFATIGWSTQIPTGPTLIGQLSNTQTILDVSEFTISGQFNPGQAGQYYIVVIIKMKYPTHVDNIVKVIPVMFGVIDQIGEVLSITDSEGELIEGEICYQQEGNITVTFANNGSDFRVLQSINGAPLSNSILDPNGILRTVTPTSVELSPFSIGLNNRICIGLLYNSLPTQTDPDEDCDCSYCNNDVAMSISRNAFSLFINAISPSLNPAQYDILDINGVQFTGAIIDGFSEIPLTQSQFPIILNVTGSTQGCHYSGTYQIINEFIPERTLQLPLSDCDCQDGEIPVNCNNTASILYSCDPETETITIDFTEITFFPIEEDIKEVSYDGGTTWEVAPSEVVGEPIVLIRRSLSFFGACPVINIIQSVSCEGETICNNSRIVEYDVTDNLLTITLTDNINSTIVLDNLLVSLDGGENFSAYVAPVLLTGGESVVITSLVTFEEDCQPLSFEISFLNDSAAQCDYDDFEAYCDEILPGIFEATFEGVEDQLIVNIKEYSIDGGTTWQVYTSSVAAELFLLRWILKFENCDTKTIVSACSPECKKMKLCEPITIGGVVEITGSVEIDGCVQECGTCPVTEENPFGTC